jgi:hypothetical protein
VPDDREPDDQADRDQRRDGVVEQRVRQERLAGAGLEVVFSVVGLATLARRHPRH